MMRPTNVHLTSVYGRIPLSRKEWLEMDNMAIDSHSNSRERPPPELPRLDLLTGSGEDYFKISIPLYEASIKGDWKSAKAIFDNNPELVSYSLTENGETALHIAVSTKQKEEFVENLVHFMNKEDLTLQNRNYNTALYLACAADNIKAVETMVNKNKALLTIPGGGGQIMPLYAAVLFESSKVVKYLYEHSHKLQDDGWTEMNRGLLLEKCVEYDFADVAVQILKDCPELADNGNVLRILARKPRHGRGPDEEYEIQILNIIWENILKKPKKEIDEILKGPRQDAVIQVTKPDSGTTDESLELQKIISEHVLNSEHDAKQDSVYKKDQAQKLEKIISENIAKMQDKTQEIIRGPAAKETGSSHVLFIAAESGNTMFIVELLRRYPDLMWSVNDNNQSIFHIAVKHRHVDIYNLLDEIGIMKHMITSLIDDHGNNMLHLAAKSTMECMDQLRYGGDVLEVALQMRQDRSWFFEIYFSIPSSYREQKNKDGLTPIELIYKEHKDLATEGERWMKEIAGQCIVVAALIATMVFTAAFTVPGGYDQNNGIPIFQSKSTYKIFVVADAISLFSSAASILYMFLSVFITSRPDITEFWQLPKKLIVGLSYLFLSITSMIIAFILSFFILYQKGRLWIPILSIGFALIPFAIFIKAPFPLLVDVICSTYDTHHLFNRKKHVLYYQNPQV